MNKRCIDCLHYEVCKYKDQEVCRGTTVADTLHECKDFKSKEKFFSKQISNVITNELGFNRTVVEEMIKQRIPEHLIESIVEQAVDKYIHKNISWTERNPEGTYFSLLVQRRIVNLVDKFVHDRIKGKTAEEIDRIIEMEVSRILANASGEAKEDE